MANAKQGSILSGMTWMFIISVLLFWLPVIGPLIAGFVGGKKAGSIENAIAAVFLPALIAGLIFFFFAAFFTGMPLIGLVAGAGGIAISLMHVGPLLVGAILGGALA
jgi:hypothetical protein